MANDKGASPSDKFGSAESWTEAQQVAALLGEVPNSFSTCIRFLRSDFEQKGSELSRGTKFYLGRLLKSVSVAAPVYFAAQTYRPELFASMGGNTEALLKTFKADELAAILSLIYLYRSIRKGCDAEEWKFVDEAVQIHVDIAGLLGDVIPTIGLANAILTAGLRPLAQAMFLGIDKKNYINYRRALKKNVRLSDLDEEMRCWNCTFGQVASILAQPIGLGLTVSQYLAVGYLPAGGIAEAKEAIGMRVTDQWLEALLKTGKQPNIAHRVEYFPHAKHVETLITQVAEIRSGGSKFRWLSAGKETATPENAPGLFEGAKAQAPAAPEPPPADAPEISEEDLKKIEE